MLTLNGSFISFCLKSLIAFPARVAETALIASLVVCLITNPLFGTSKNLLPEEVYNQVSGSVTMIRDLESHGSGVVLTRDGVILTNLHVVASGLPLTVSAKVRHGGKLVEKTFENVVVSKIHPDYDLAMLKIDFPEGEFLPANLLGKKDEISTGAVCYAIGNPGGAYGKPLVHSITEGLVSSSSRIIDGQNYIQTSAPLNPGNSGGAVSDSQGRVIGIATWKLVNADNIGFAIPLQKLQLDKFIPLEKKKPNLELGVKYEKEGRRIADYAQSLDGDERDLAIRMAAFFYRKCLECVPNDPAPYNNIGTMYFRLKEDDIARRYFERALQIRPLYASSMSMLGIIIARGNGDLKVANELWFRGTEDKDSADGASDCAESLAISFVNANEYVAAAYCIRWANILHSAAPHRVAVRKKIWEESVEKLSEVQFSALKIKESDFSRANLEAFVKEVGLQLQPENSLTVEKTNVKGTSTQEGQLEPSYFVEVAAKMAASGVVIPQDGISKPLPGVPSSIIVGYAGTCLLMKFAELNRIGVFDLCQAKVTKYINLTDEDAIFSAGGKVLVIYYPRVNRIELWDMESWTKTKDVSLRSVRQFTAIGMGLLNNDFAVVTRAESNGQEMDKVAILSLPEGKLSVPQIKQSPRGMDMSHFFGHLSKNVIISVEENGNSALIMAAGRGFFNLANRSIVEASYFHMGSLYNGSMVSGGSEVVIANSYVNRSGEEEDLLRVYDENHNRQNNRQSVIAISGYRGIAELRLDDNRKPIISIRSLPILNEVSSIPLNKVLYRNIHMGSNSFRLFASAYVNRIAIVGLKEKNITILPMPDVGARFSSEISNGSLFSRTLTFAEGTKVVVESGPEGLVYDSKSKQIRWEIPQSQPRGVEISVIFHLTDPDGKESYHVETIVIR